MQAMGSIESTKEIKTQGIGFEEHQEDLVQDQISEVSIDIDVNNITEITSIDETEVSAVVGKVKSSVFGGLVKVLSLLSSGMSSQDILSIKEGKLSTIKGGGFIYSDLSILFDKNDLEIIDPQKSLKLLNLIKGGEEVIFVKDDDYNRYIVSNINKGKPQTTISLPIPEESSKPNLKIPEIGVLKTSIEIDPDIIDTINNSRKIIEAPYFKVKLDEEFNIISISTSDDVFKHIFVNEDDIKGETKEYKLFDVLPVTKPNEFSIEIHQNQDQVWVKSISDIGMIQIEYIENIQELNEFDTFSIV